MIEATLAFTAGAVLGASVKALMTGSVTPTPTPPPPPPPPPVPAHKKPKTRIFYKMKELPLTADGEDTGIRDGVVVISKSDDVVMGKQPCIAGRPRITDQVIAAVVLKKAPPPMSVEEKRTAFFQPMRPVHAELLQRVQALQPQL